MADEIEKCSYEKGPCTFMAEYHQGSGAGPRAKGIFAFDNLVNMKDKRGRFFHAGFLYRDPETTGAKGVMLNFCPWCGGDLEAWTNAALAESRSVTKAAG